jgi:exopolysaccharide production protein ExoY
MHSAVVEERFMVRAVMSIDVERDDADEIAGRLGGMLKTGAAETIMVAGPVGERTMRRLGDLALLYHCELVAVMPTEVLADHDPVIVWSGESPLVQLASIPERKWGLAAKRAVDVVGASLGLIVAAPLLLVVSALITLDSPGSPLFLHERIGQRGRRFRCFKLRTMRTGAEDELRADPAMYEEYRKNHFKIPDGRDPRTTRLGRFLRRTSLDELPQLWNVLKGEMSLVGPRPVVEEELSLYGTAKDVLLSMRPGITGAWAVGGRHDVGYPYRCELELRYVRQWTPVKDLEILAATVQTVLSVIQTE